MRAPKTVTLASDGLGLAAVLALVIAVVVVGYLLRGYPFSLAAPVGFVLFRLLRRRIARLRGDTTAERTERKAAGGGLRVQRWPGRGELPSNLYELQDALRRGHQNLSQDARQARGPSARESEALGKTQLVQLQVATLTGVRNAVTSVAIGVGLVGAVQAAVSLLGEEAGQSALEGYQRTLVGAKEALEIAGGLWLLVAVSVTLVALTVWFPRLRLMDRFLSLRKAAGAALVSATTASLFTFAAAGTVALKQGDWEREAEQRWVMGRRAHVERLLREREEDGLRSLASEQLKSDIARADATVKAHIREAVARAQQENVRVAARSVVSSHAHEWKEARSEGTTGRPSSEGTRAKPAPGVEAVERWLQKSTGAEIATDIPSRAAIAAFEEDAARVHAAREEAEKGVVEVISSAVLEQLPGGEILNSFVEELISAAVERWVSWAAEHAIRGLEAARRWVEGLETPSVLATAEEIRKSEAPPKAPERALTEVKPMTGTRPPETRPDPWKEAAEKMAAEAEKKKRSERAKEKRAEQTRKREVERKARGRR